MSPATGISILIVAIPLIVGIVKVVYAWPAGTSEETQNKILAVISDHELTVEESGIAENKVYEIFESFPPDSKQYKELMTCGFADKLAFEVLQCYREVVTYNNIF
jgi:hypothetical protein